MRKFANGSNDQESAIGGLLRYGTWLASTVIGVGLAAKGLHIPPKMAPLGLTGPRLIEGGVVLMILLPILRVGLMFFLFARERDTTYMAISTLVLAIIAAGFLAGL